MCATPMAWKGVKWLTLNGEKLPDNPFPADKLADDNQVIVELR